MYVHFSISHKLSSSVDDPPPAWWTYPQASPFTATTMPKGSKLRAHHADRTPYHRQDKHQESNHCKHDDRVRASRSDGGECKSSLQSSSFRKHHVPPINTRSFLPTRSRETQLRNALAKRQSSGDLAAASTAGTPEAATQSLCGILTPTSPHLSEASTVPVQFDDSIFAETSPNAKLEDFDFEFDSVVQIDGDQCQVRWADSIIRDRDLYRRCLHGRLLLDYMASSVTLGRGLSKVMWEPTWEPVDILRGYKDVVQRESQFEFGDVIEEQGGNSLVQWESSVIHESTIETLSDHPLLNQVESLSYPLAYGFAVVAWKPMWVPTHIMEAYGGTD
jgi:hypothetical protein